MLKISQKLKKKLTSLGVKVPEDLYMFRLDSKYFKELTNEEMGELFHFFMDNRYASRIICARKNGNRQEPDIRRGKIYLADLDPYIGSEQGCIRPVMILQNDLSNKRSGTVIIAAITTRKKKDEMPTHVHFRYEQKDIESCVLLEQLRSIDKSRLICYLGEAAADVMRRVDRALAYSLGL